MPAISLSSTPSPTLSPSAAFRSTYPSQQRSPGLSAHLSARQSPRRAAAAAASSSRSPTWARREQFANERNVPVRTHVRYVDSGTQYSPEWYPPTAGNVAATGGSEPAAGSAGAKKRKDAASDEAADGHMSSATRESKPGPGAAGYPREPDSNAAAAASSSSQEEPVLQEARSTHGYSAAPKRSKQDPATSITMPARYETCDPKDLGKLISNMLMELIRINDQIPLRDGRLTRFHSRAPPGISVSDYLQRLIQHATLSPPILLSMVYYIDRLCTMYSNFTINSLTVHRFLITAATVAAKGLSDSFWTNPTYARIGGIPVPELATLELELLQRVHWKIVPKPEALEEYYSSLVDRTEGYTLESPDISDASGAEEDAAMDDSK